MTRFFKKLMWFGLGWLGAYLFDPVQGRSRRARLEDQAAAQVRDLERLARKKARYQIGKVRGVAHEMLTPERVPVSDDKILQKVKSEAVGMTPADVSHVDVSVKDGVVFLNGLRRDTRAERELIRRIYEVDGVRQVRNQLVAS
ncbi:MAG: BON domain-containing protein [Actinobacteria bacterium]|nr:MAG: BON domain-containing protein [Actinomycetota bacterium]